MDNAPRYAKNKLREASRAKDESRRVTVGFRTAAAALVVVLAIALLDYWFMLPMGARLGGMAVLAVLIGAGFWQLGRSFTRPTPLKEAALDAEAQRPELGCEISTAAEYLSGERKPTLEYEGAIVDALEEKAANHLRTLNLPYWERPIRPAILLGLVVLAMLVFGGMATGAWTAFQRAAVPWSQAAYTQVEVMPGNIEIPVGRDLEIKSLFRGRPPKQARFHWREEGWLDWQEAALTLNETGEYVYPLKNIQTSLKYRVSGSDAVSPAYAVEAYVPPEVKAWRIELNLPEYTKRAPIRQETPEITVLRGTTASFQIIPTAKLSKGRLRFKDLPAVELRPDERGAWQGELLVSTNAEYWIELADEKGRAGGNQAPYLIKALPDQAPLVEIPEPGQDRRAEATNHFPVKVTVTDDFGIDQIKLLYHRLGGPLQEIAATRQGETNATFLAEIPLPAMDLKEFEVVAYHAEAVDNNTLDGPGVGKSEVYFIEITNLEGGACPPRGNAQRVNLLVIQKQIIADTTALAKNAPAEKFDDLARRQEDAAEFGQMYMDGLTALQAPEEAIQEMAAAINDMDRAKELLVERERNGALPSEESALARLYHLLKMMPELKDLPTTPEMSQEQKQEPPSPVVNVVLEAIKKKKEEQPDSKEVEAVMEAAQRLQQEQANLNLDLQNAERQSSPGEAQADPPGNEASQQAQGQAKGQQEGKGQGQGQGQGESQSPGEEGQSEDQEGEGKEGEFEKLADLEKALSEQVAALAEKLARLAGKESRLGHNAAKKMSEAAGKMRAAADAMGRGDMRTAGTRGMQGEASLESAIGLLERMLTHRPERTDVSQEDFPKEYETAISEYLKTLSREE